MQSKEVKSLSLLRYNGLTSGYSFRGKISNVPFGDIRIIQLKDLEENYTSISNDCFLIDGDKVKPKYYLENGDILFTSKGTNNYALVFQKTDEIPTIASSALFKISINNNKADPHYIAWFINQNEVQNYLKTNESGTYTTSINKKAIEEIPVTLPDLKTQKKIAHIARLHHQERKLSLQLSVTRDSLITQQLLNSI